MKKRNNRVNLNKKVQTNLVCSVCGSDFNIWRYRCRQHKAGHIKHMWCPYCHKESEFIETKSETKTLSGDVILDLY